MLAPASELELESELADRVPEKATVLKVEALDQLDMPASVELTGEEVEVTVLAALENPTREEDIAALAEVDAEVGLAVDVMLISMLEDFGSSLLDRRLVAV